jgi:hypothetical protein
LQANLLLLDSGVLLDKNEVQKLLQRRTHDKAKKTIHPKTQKGFSVLFANHHALGFPRLSPARPSVNAAVGTWSEGFPR